MGIEVFGNNANTTVSSGGGGTPMAGTQETWTVSSLGTFPLVSSGASPATWLHITDIALDTELIQVINMSGGGNLTWLVVRGVEGSVPVAHTAGFTVYQVTSAGFLGGLVTLAGDLGGNVSSPTVAKIQGTAVSSPPGGTTQFLRGDGTWQVPGGTGFSNPMTTAGDIIIENASPAVARLGVGSTGQVLTVSGGLPSWQNASSGFSNPMTTKGDLIIENATPAPARLAIGSTGQILTVASGLPSWAAAPGGLTVTGTQAAGEAPVATSGAACSWNGIFGTRPEWFGTISGTSGDEVAINAAISAVAAGAAGCPGPVVISQPCAVSNSVTAQPGVNLYGTGQGNRQVFPDTFKGGYLFPSASFGTGVPLITIGTVSAPTTNPNGIRLDGICVSGLKAGGSNATGAIGVLINDTTDVHIIGGFFANFDRTGQTGTCIYSTSATAGNGYGLNLQNCVLSASWQGLFTTGAGVTDMRFSGNLWHSNTEQCTIGSGNLGGGGTQICNDHFTYSAMASTGWHLWLGSQAGDFVISSNYFDQANSAVPVQFATAKGIFSGNHFLATGSSTAASLVKLSTANQEITFCNNDCNGNGSSITALFQTSAHSGAPTGGIYTGNAVYGTASSLIDVLIDSGGSSIAPSSTGSLYVAGNCQFS